MIFSISAAIEGTTVIRRESYLSEYVMTFARATVTSHQARAAYRIAQDENGAIDLIDDPQDRSPTFRQFFSSPLPSNLSAWRFDDDVEFHLTWRLPYSDTLFQAAILQGDAYAIHLFDVTTAHTGTRSTYRGNQVMGGGHGLMTLQNSLERKFTRRRLLGKEDCWQINWKFDSLWFTPCTIDLDDPQSVYTGNYFAKDVDDAFATCKKLMTVTEAPPAYVTGELEFTGPNAIESFLAAVPDLNRQHRNWTLRTFSAYKDGFDPFARPEHVPETGLHYSVAMKGRGVNGVEFQLDMVHTPEGSYLEVLTGYGMDNLRRWTELFPGLEWEYWPGASEERWTGDPTPVPLPQITPVNPLSIKTELEYKFHFFVHERVLTIIIDPGLNTIRPQFSPTAANQERQRQGYTPHEIFHLGDIDSIEARFDEICTRVPEWDSIRFWWPHKGEKAYWDQRPKLRGVKTLPMKIRGEVRDIPVEFVEPLKCPM